MELVPLLGEPDLQLVGSAMAVLAFAVLKSASDKAVATAMQTQIAPMLLTLIASQLISGTSGGGGHARDTLIRLLAGWAKARPADAEPFMTQILKSCCNSLVAAPRDSSNDLLGVGTAADCFSCILSHLPQPSIDFWFKNIRKSLGCPESPRHLLFYLRVVGELGRRGRSEIADKQTTEFLERLLTSRQRHTGDLGSADATQSEFAAFALGGLAAGAPSQIGPIVVKAVQTDCGRFAVEAANCFVGAAIRRGQTLPKDSIIRPLWERLTNGDNHQLDDGSSSSSQQLLLAKGDLLFRLCLADLSLTGQWRSIIKQSPADGLLFVAAFRSAACADNSLLPEQTDHFISTFLPDLLGLLSQTESADDLSLRRIGLSALNSCLHNKYALLGDCTDRLIACIRQDMRVRENLIRTIDMGPFKHKVDDGLEIRKVHVHAHRTRIITYQISTLDRLRSSAFTS